MDPDNLVRLLAQQRQVLKAASSRKGQKPSDKPSRLQLELQFRVMRAQQQRIGHWMRQHFVNHSYPPSTKPITKLVPITMLDLRLETHHTGKVLFVRTFTYPVRMSAVQAAVEDVNGDVDRLAVYNSDPLLGPEYVLPERAVFAIKEPYYKTTGDGGSSIRVDHPSDLVRLHLLDEILPIEFRPRLIELETSVQDWKKGGNAAYTSGNYLAAINAYSQGLTLTSDITAALKCDLLRNRSICNLYLKRYEPAMLDAENSIALTPTLATETTTELNAKAHYRAGRAADELAQYDRARSHFETVRELSPGDRDAVRELDRTTARQTEQTSGVYDFVRMSKLASKKQNRLDHGSFLSKISIRATGKRGRGAFAVADIKAGEIIMCEKAFAVAFNSDEGSQTFMIMNINTDRGSTGTQARLLFQVVQKMLHNPLQAALFFGLHDGGYSPNANLQIVDGLATVDVFRTQAIIEINCFGCPTVSSTHETSPHPGSKDNAALGSTGVWITASHINHACDGNARRAFVGDMMIIRATKDIAAGAEILMPYMLVEADVTESQNKLKQNWAFTCDCIICSVEKKSTPSQRKARVALAQEAKQLCDSNAPTKQFKPNASTVARAEKLYSQLEQTYDPKLFVNVPRVALVDLGLWLCQARSSKPNNALITAATRVLNSLGYSVVVTGKTVRFDYAHCHLVDSAIDASLYAASAYNKQGDFAIGAQFVAFGKELYRTMFGELCGFKERFGVD